MPTVAQDKKQIASTVSHEIVDRIQYWAAKDNRSFSSTVGILLNEALDKRDGVKPKSNKSVKK